MHAAKLSVFSVGTHLTNHSFGLDETLCSDWSGGLNPAERSEFQQIDKICFSSSRKMGAHSPRLPSVSEGSTEELNAIPGSLKLMLILIHMIALWNVPFVLKLIGDFKQKIKGSSAKNPDIMQLFPTAQFLRKCLWEIFEKILKGVLKFLKAIQSWGQQPNDQSYHSTAALLET